MLIYQSGIVILMLFTSGVVLQDEAPADAVEVETAEIVKEALEDTVIAADAVEEAIAEEAGTEAVSEPIVIEEAPPAISEAPAPPAALEVVEPAPATWSIIIRPSAKVPKDYRPSKSTAVQEETDEAKPVSSDHYARVYNSIPFNRAEYHANPSYRHDATMEFLFGELRPTTINRYPAQPYRSPGSDLYQRYYIEPYLYNGNLNRNRRLNGLNYYFYFPAWNARGFY